MPGAGSLRERLNFQRRSYGDDGYGTPTVGEFAFAFCVAAAFRPLKGGEDVIASRLAGAQPYIITVRQSSLTRQVTTDWRIEDARTAGRIFDIRTIADPDGRRAWFEILAVEGRAT